jgi:hypothetical protein
MVEKGFKDLSAEVRKRPGAAKEIAERKRAILAPYRWAGKKTPR